MNRFLCSILITSLLSNGTVLHADRIHLIHHHGVSMATSPHYFSKVSGLVVLVVCVLYAVFHRREAHGKIEHSAQSMKSCLTHELDPKFIRCSIQGGIA